MWYLCLLTLVGLTQTCSGGGLYPGGLESTVEAHGPLARLAVDSSVASGGLHYYHAQLSPVASHTPIAVEARHATLTAPAVTPVDVVHHVPHVADVPVTKYLAQPGYVQKLVDIPKAKVAVAKLQVKRPAIQKQFYDIEERTIIRPVGSAVVEFEEPISKKFVTPFTVTPNNYHTVPVYHRPLVYPVGSHPFVTYAPFQTPVQHYHPFFIQQTPQYPFPQPPQQYPTLPMIPQLPQQPTTTPSQTPPQPPQQTPSFPKPPQPSPDESPSNSEFDSSDTIVVDNPDFARARASTDQPQRATEKEDSFDAFEKEVNNHEGTDSKQDQDQAQVIQNILNDFENRQFLRTLSRQSKILSQQKQNFQILIEPLNPLQQYQERQGNQLSYDQLSQRSQDTDSNPTSEASTSTQTEVSFKSSGSTNNQDHEGTNAAIPSGIAFRSSFNSQEVPKNEAFGEGQFSFERNIAPADLQDNQQKLIELLTGRGEVSEVALSRAGVKLTPVGDSGVVRGRVVSVTPAPRGQDGDGEERISTRRVVVSRPVQTVEEVDVKQPFTKLERVAVHEPALLNTAHTHIARVPTAVPVLTRSFAPVLYH